ncbi:hypothetical protein SEUCBS139899_008197 [Sporothrix eucalyptigena]|uniref:MARVEL domain-containing protein n=1 Tax=Sporothrix eucalyptigena TaxID=1812306 RepID=A0ABP0BU62_9PEZI
MARSGIGLKLLQFFFRTVIFLCAIVVVVIFAYFLAKLNSADLYVPTWVRAVEGLSAAAALYILIALLLLWFVGGYIVMLGISVLLDICFIGGFIYIATANRGGSGSCNRDNIRSPFGSGDANTDRIINRAGTSVNIPSYRVSCRLQKACLAVSIIAIGFLLFAIGTEFLLARNHRKEKKFGPGPNNDYTSGSGRRRGLFGKKRNATGMNGGKHQDPNALPQHTEPGQMRESYATEATAVGQHGYGENGAIDPNKLAENQRTYGKNYDTNTPVVVPNTTHANNPRNTSTFRGASTDPNFREGGVDPNLQSSVNPAVTSSGVLAEGPEAPTVRGTGVDNYANIRAAAAEKSYNATHPDATAGYADAGANTTNHGAAGGENYGNVRGAAVDPNVWGGAIDPATGQATGLRGSYQTGARNVEELAADNTTSKYGNPPQF